MVLKKIEIVGLILMLLHWMVLRVSAARHGMDVGSIAESNLDEQTVEQMCRDCGLDLIAIKEEVQKSGAYLSKDIFLDSTKISTRAELLTKGTIQEALNVLSPEANRSFLDCLMKRNFLLDSSQEEILRIWLTDYLDSLLNQLHTRRRLLAAQDYEDMSPSLAPDLPSNDDSTLPNEPTSEPALAKKLPGPPSKISTLLNSGDPQPPNNLVKVRDAIFISVFMTAVLTATLVTLLLSCYFACEKKSRYTGYRRKDDKPLLTLSLSNVSGSSQKSFGNRNSLLALPKPLETDPTSQNIQVSSTDSSVDTESTEIFQASPNFGSSQKSFGNGNSLLVPPKPLKPNPTSQNIQLSFTDSSVDTESTEIFQASPNFGSSQKSFGNGSSLLAPPKPLKTDPTSQNIQVSSTDSSVETESSKIFQDSPNFGSSQKSFGNGNSLLALPNPLKTDPTSQNIQVSSTDSSVETQSSEVLQASPFSLDEQSNIITDEANLSKSPPPPPPPVVPTPLGKPSPPSPPPLKAGPSPPPPPKCAAPPRPPQAKLNFLRMHKPPPLAPKLPGETVDVEDDSYAPKTKLKPFFWDKVQANCARSMVWDRLRTGSFQFDEEMIENLFGYSDKNKEGKKVLSPKDAGRQYVRILDPKKSQNLAISLRALNVKSEEVREALMEGNELPPELLHTLLKMAPTTDEEMKIRLHADPTQLGPAEQFIRTIVDVPFAFQRLEALLFMISLQEESSSISEAFSVIDVACKELKSSRLFLKLLEAVLKMGNRMNDGTYRGRAQAFKLDTLLKLSDVKGTDGKTTLLHFVVREIIRTEGKRASRTTGESPSSISSLNSEDLFDDPPVESGDYYYNLGFKVVSGLSDELQHVRKAAGLDADMLANNVESLRERLAKTKDFLKTKMEGIDEESEFLRSLRGFVKHAEAEINTLSEEEKRIRSLVKNTTDYFHGNSAKDEGLRMLVIVRDFLGMIDKVCKEVKVLPKPAIKTQRSREVTPAMSPARDPRQLLFPAIKDRRMNSSDSSDDDD